MKKVLIGLGVGCGVLVLLAVVGVGVAGYWAKQKLGGAIESAEKMQKQEERLQALNQKFAFSAPGEGQVLALDAKRLEAYLAVRESGLPVFAKFEAQAKELEQLKQSGEQASLGDAMKAGGMLMDLTTQTREAFIASLEQHDMSPAEFHATTQAIYSTVVGTAMQGMHKELTKAAEQAQARIEELETKLEDEKLPEAERQALQAEHDALYAQVESMEQAPAAIAPGQEEVVAANAKLLEAHKARIETAANPAFDMFIVGGGAVANGSPE